MEARDLTSVGYFETKGMGHHLKEERETVRKRQLTAVHRGKRTTLSRCSVRAPGSATAHALCVWRRSAACGRQKWGKSRRGNGRRHRGNCTIQEQTLSDWGFRTGIWGASVRFHWRVTCSGCHDPLSLTVERYGVHVWTSWQNSGRCGSCQGSHESCFQLAGITSAFQPIMCGGFSLRKTRSTRPGRV